MKLSELIRSLTTVKDHDEDYDVAYLIFTINDLKNMFPEEYKKIFKDDSKIIIEKIQSYFEDNMSDSFYDGITQVINEVHNKRLKDCEDYKLYLKLKAQFESN